VTSIVDDAVGRYTVNLTSAMANANYVVVGCAASGSIDPTTAQYSNLVATDRLAGSFQVRCVDSAGAGGYEDTPLTDIVVFGEPA